MDVVNVVLNDNGIDGMVLGSRCSPMCPEITEIMSAMSFGIHGIVILRCFDFSLRLVWLRSPYVRYVEWEVCMCRKRHY